MYAQDDHSYNPENEPVSENILARIFYNVNDRATLLDGMMKFELWSNKANYLLE